MKKAKSPTETQHTSSHPPLARILRIHEQIQSEKYPNCSSLGQMLDISYKTIQRDIDFMKSQWEMPIEYDAAKRGFYYSKPIASLPTLTVSGGELVALLVAHKAAEQYRGTPFEKPIQSAFEKLAALTSDGIKVSIPQLAEAFTFEPVSLAQSEMAAFVLVADAVMNSQELAFECQDADSCDSVHWKLEPYYLGCVSDQWYLIGNDSEKNAIRIFLFSRMKDTGVTGRTFIRPKSENIAKLFERSFSAFEARKTAQVRLRLDERAAEIARRKIWHTSQKLERLKKGGALLTLNVPIAPDLESWILSWGNRVEVLAPAALRKTIAKRLKEASKIYRK